MPDDFKAKGPAVLQRILAMAEDPAHAHHFDAVRWVAERIYGKAMQAHEVHTSRGLLVDLLSRPAPPIPDHLTPDDLKAKP